MERPSSGSHRECVRTSLRGLKELDGDTNNELGLLNDMIEATRIAGPPYGQQQLMRGSPHGRRPIYRVPVQSVIDQVV